MKPKETTDPWVDPSRLKRRGSSSRTDATLYELLLLSTALLYILLFAT